MRNILLIAKREYLEQIHGRAFRLSTVLVPLLIAVLLGASYFTSRNATAGKHVAVAAGSAPLANDIRRWLLDDKDAKFTVDVFAPATPQDRDALLKLVQSRAIDGLLWVESSPAGAPAATYTSQSAGDFTTTSRLKYALNRALLNERLTARGMKPAEADALLKEVSIETLQVNKEGKATKSNRMASFSKAIAMAFLLTMPILLYGLDMARSIIEEKNFAHLRGHAGRRPSRRSAGWQADRRGRRGPHANCHLGGCGGAAIGLRAGRSAAHRRCRFPFLLDRGRSLSGVLCAGLLALQLALFRPRGHLRDGAGVADVYAAGCRARLAQLRHHPFLINNPDSVWSVAASLFPPTAPFVMFPRMGLQTPPMWQFAVSIGLMILSIWAVLWFSSRLYRVGILMYGKRATLPELVALDAL